MKLGARILKTGISVSLALYLCTWLNLDAPVFAAIAAALTIQPSLYRSWQHMVEQLQANAMGALIAIGAVYLLGNDHIIIGLVVILVIMIHIKLGYEKSVTLSMVTVLALMVGSENITLLAAAQRFLPILLGIFSSLIINAIFLPPKYEARLEEKTFEVVEQIHQLMVMILDEDTEEKEFRKAKRDISDTLRKIDEIYALYREEKTYFKKMKYSKTRKLVIFKQLITVCRNAYQVLEALERHLQKLEIQQASDIEMMERLREQTLLLTDYHKKVLFKYEGKIKTHHPHEKSKAVDLGTRRLIDTLIKEYENSTEFPSDRWDQQLFIIAQLLVYAQQLDRLEKRIDHYRHHHA